LCFPFNASAKWLGCNNSQPSVGISTTALCCTPTSGASDQALHFIQKSCPFGKLCNQSAFAAYPEYKVALISAQQISPAILSPRKVSNSLFELASNLLQKSNNPRFASASIYLLNSSFLN